MHDLRKKVLLESDKTLSRKARSKLGTPTISRANSATTSPRGSHVASRDVSDDESDISDGTQWSTNSLSELLASSEYDSTSASDAWVQDLNDRVTLICDRKRSSAQGREETLIGFIVHLTRHYALDEIKSYVGDLVPALLKSVKAGQTEREISLALKALALILITDPSDTIYDAIQAPVKTLINDSEYASAKVAGIHTLSVATFYGGASISETEEVMELFLDIASSDGAVVGEPDNAHVVTAALEEWGFLATQIDDMEDATEPAMDIFVDQLESSDAGVQISAGENIALLFEKSYTEQESGEDEPAEDEDDDDESANNSGPRMIKRYVVYRQIHQLSQTLADLAKASSKRISKKDRKQLHLAFNDILTTVEKPTRGPRYSTALDIDGHELGSRLKIYVQGGGSMIINTWWKLHRLNSLKRLLQAGFLTHYEHNQVVFDSLPVVIDDDE